MWRAAARAASFLGLGCGAGATVRAVNEAIVVNDGLWLQAILHDGKSFLTFVIGVAVVVTVVLINAFQTVASSQANQQIAARERLGVK